MPSHDLGIVDHAAVQAYLERHGWCRVASRRSYAAIYRNGRALLDEVQVPLDRTLADYDEALTGVVRRLAAFEKRTEEAVLDDLLGLRSARKPQPDPFVGKVVKLMGGPGCQGAVEGPIVLQVQVDDELLKARVTLGAADYRKAVDAHLGQFDVTVRGVLRRGTRVHWIDEAAGFEIVSKATQSF
ncbi:hypothetical protein JY651_34615 [Pyxidicoccus parkwayensis]|uniref:Uncharacterized protein n=1 Tax=Pyxidicoccus parkwayensis TaxID=2813578 RepID=A0ABX7NSF7_9BACT|nr:hypothetical protein [Pyxidicoccus parkwaysis]QSQ20359.1 hypothetical protein JY651_34615 [Pyxidicoccus parkwaysis]